MILTHFSEEPFSFEIDRKYVPGKVQAGALKPHGLWLSDERDYGWRQWCEAEEFALNRLAHATEFECDISRYCVIETGKDILAFTEKFRGELPGMPALGAMFIDWVTVQQEFSGMLITPYSWKFRLDPRAMWYYGWDCASACVWDLSTVTLRNAK